MHVTMVTASSRSHQPLKPRSQQLGKPLLTGESRISASMILSVYGVHNLTICRCSVSRCGTNIISPLGRRSVRRDGASVKSIWLYDAPTANSDANLLPSGPFIAGELIGDLRFVTDDYHGELVRHDVLL